MPQFDITTFASQIFWLIVSFAIVFLFIWRIGLPRIANTLENRQKKIGDDIDKANELAVQTDEVMAAYEEKLADARASALEELHVATVQAVENSDKQNVILANISESLGSLIAHLINTVDPDSVVLGGGVTINNLKFKKLLIKYSRNYILSEDVKNINFLTSKLKDDTGLLGAAAIFK